MRSLFFLLVVNWAALAVAGKQAGGDSENESKTEIVETFDGEKLRFYNGIEAPFEVNGFAWRKNGEELYRLPRHLTEKDVKRGALSMAHRTSGGVIRFTTNARRIVLRAQFYASYPGSQNRFDVILNAGTGKDYFFRSIQASLDPLAEGKVEQFIFRTPNETRNYVMWTIYLPLYCGIKSLQFGVEPDAEFKPNRPYKISKPICFYGSSITQGGFASRPANNYPAMLCRTLDAPLINLGFSGSAYGEPAMAQAIAELDLAALVMDYDYNSPNEEHLAATHEKFFKIIRAAHPDLPIVIISRCSLYDLKRTAVCRATYEHALEAGDKNVYFIDGSMLFGEPGPLYCTVDLCHPNDLGFYMMFKGILPTLKKALLLQE